MTVEPEAILDRLSAALGAHPFIANLHAEEGVRVESAGGESAEAERWRSAHLSVEVEAGPGRVGFAQTPIGSGGFDGKALAARALASARALDPDPARSVPERLDPLPGVPLDILDESFDVADAEGALAFAQRLEAGCRAADHRVYSVRKPGFEGVRESRALLLSTGEVRSWRATSFSLRVEAAAKSGGMAESGWASASARSLARLDPEATGAEAAHRAAELLGAGRGPSGRMALLLDARVARDLLDVLAPSLLGESFEKGTSLFAGRLGDRVFAPAVEIRDDGLLAGGADTDPLDDEGSARRLTPCVCGGRLEQLLYDRASARRAGTATTGNGAGGGEGPVVPEPTNLYLAPGGGGDAAALMARMGRGIFVREVMGLHTVDPVSGDFSLGCAGFRVEGGRAAAPFAGAAVAGNLKELFLAIEAVGDDLGFDGSLGAPSILVGAADVSGG